MLKIKIACGGFVFPTWFAFGVCFSPLRLALVLLVPPVGGFVRPYFCFLRSWSWFLDLCVYPWFCAVVSFHLSFARRLVLVGPVEELGRLCCELVAFKYGPLVPAAESIRAL